MINLKWTKQEKKIARIAFDKAYQKECQQIISEIKNTNLEKPEDLWDLCNILNDRRNEIDKIYDYRYSQLIHVFALLIKRDFLRLNDLEGLSDEQLNKIQLLLEL